MNYILSKFSHELRNPLTTVYSTVQLIELQHPEVKEFKYWSNLTFDLSYIITLLDDLSDFSKSENLQLSHFSLRTLLEQIVLSFAASIVDSGVEFTAKISPSINQINGDKTKLQEVFLNLLKNAFEAAAPSQTIALEAALSGQNIVICVHDTGCGISEEQLAHIFEPFATYKKDGTGLGLAICDQIIRAHKGSISVTSSVGKGTSFTISLPVDPLSLVESP